MFHIQRKKHIDFEHLKLIWSIINQFAFSVNILTIITFGVPLVVRGITATSARLAIHIR